MAPLSLHVVLGIEGCTPPGPARCRRIAKSRRRVMPRERRGRGSPSVKPDIPRGPMVRTGPFARRTTPGGGDASPGPRIELGVAQRTNASEMPRRFGLQLWEESAACCRAVTIPALLSHRGSSAGRPGHGRGAARRRNLGRSARRSMWSRCYRTGWKSTGLGRLLVHECRRRGEPRGGQESASLQVGHGVQPLQGLRGLGSGAAGPWP